MFTTKLIDMKAFLMTDLEGVAGVVSFGLHAYGGTRYEENSRRLLTAEVNACVEGLLEQGYTDIAVLDGHGEGGIVFEEIHPEARLIHGRPLSPAWASLLEGVDVGLFIGQHAMAGVADANLGHTQDSRSITSYHLNGKPIGEIAQFALFAGSYGVPIVFLSGDEAACREVSELIPGVGTIAVKTGLGRNSAVSMSAPKARESIRRGVKEAIARHRKQPVAPLRWPGPYVLEKRFFTTDRVEEYRALARANPSIEIVDSLTVRLRGTDIRAVVYE
jgi:D-amino peptidase